MGSCNSSKNKTFNKIEDKRFNQEIILTQNARTDNFINLAKPHRLFQKRMTLNLTQDQLKSKINESPEIKMKRRKSVKNNFNPEFKFIIYSEKSYDNIRYIESIGEIKIFSVSCKITKKKYKVKQIPINQNNKEVQLYLNETVLLKNLDHPQIARYSDVFSDSQNYFFFREERKEENLLRFIEKYGPLNEFECAMIAYQMLDILVYLKKKKLIHRHIKPENILISDFKIENKFNYIYLSDFRMAKKFEKEENIFNDLVGVNQYFSPEILKKNNDEKCDLWSLGILLYFVLEGKLPFNGITDEEITKSIQTDDIRFQTNISDLCKKFIQSLLEKNQISRLSAIQAISHKWIKNLRVGEKFDVEHKKIINIIENIGNSAPQIRPIFIQYLAPYLLFTKEIFERQNIFRYLNCGLDWEISKEDIIESYSNLRKSGFKAKNIKKLNGNDNIFEELSKKENRFKLNFQDFIYFTIDRNILLENSNSLYYCILRELETFNLIDLNRVFYLNSSAKMITLENFIREKQELSNGIDIESFRMILKILLFD